MFISFAYSRASVDHRWSSRCEQVKQLHFTVFCVCSQLLMLTLSHANQRWWIASLQLCFVWTNLWVQRCIRWTDKNKPQGGGETTSDFQKQTQDTNETALINKLLQEKNQLKKENDDLLAKLAASLVTKGRWFSVCKLVLLFSHTCQLLAHSVELFFTVW